MQTLTFSRVYTEFTRVTPSLEAINIITEGKTGLSTKERQWERYNYVLSAYLSKLA